MTSFRSLFKQWFVSRGWTSMAAHVPSVHKLYKLWTDQTRRQLCSHECPTWQTHGLSRVMDGWSSPSYLMQLQVCTKVFFPWCVKPQRSENECRSLQPHHSLVTEQRGPLQPPHHWQMIGSSLGFESFFLWVKSMIPRQRSPWEQSLMAVVKSNS